MASTDKKKVKITETSKQANVDIISETIQLPADSADHTLVAKVPSSANCTSGVNVEVEMSPDGVNWCPALRKETVTTAGGTTAEIIGNVKYVDLQKNDPVFNSYAKGGLNFDVNGNEVALGTGDRDLLDQHIAVNKSFNHSMWIKSDTLPDIARDETVTFTVTVSGGLFYINGVAQSSVYLKEGSTYTFNQADSSNSGHPLRFSTADDGTHSGGTEYTTGVTTVGTPGSAGAYTKIVVAKDSVDLYYYCSNHSGMGGSAFTPVSKPYKPVLFRHGGYDTFENTKVVQLEDNHPSGTPIQNTFKNGAAFAKGAAGATFNETYYNSTSSWTHAFWVKGQGATTGSDWGLDGPVNQWFTNYVRIQAGVVFDYSAQRLAFTWLGAGIDTGNLIYSGTVTGSSTLHPGETNDEFCSQWFLCVATHDYDSATGTQTFKQYMYTEDGRSWGGGTSGNVTRTSTAVTYNGRTIDGTSGGQGDVCQYFIWNKALSSSEVSDLLRTSPLGGNNKCPEDPTSLSTASNLIGWYTFGDDPLDTSSSINNAAPGSSIPDLYTSGNTYVSIPNTESVFMGGPIRSTQNLVESKSTFSTQSNKIAPPSTGGGGIIVQANTPAATFYGSSGQVDNGNESDIGKHLIGIWNPHEDFSTSRWMFQNNAEVAGFRHRSSSVFFGYPDINYQTSTYIRFYGGMEFSPFITYSATDAASKILPVRAVITGQSGSYWYVYNSNPVLEFTRRSDNTTFTVNPFTGYHVSITYTAPADITQGIPEANLAMYVNGQRVKIVTTTENNVEYAWGAAPADALFSGDEGFAANSNWGGAQYLDYGTNYSYNTVINNHMDFQGRVLSESDILKLYNDGKLLDFSNIQTSFPISLSNCVGAYDTDVPYYYADQGVHIAGLEDCSGYGKRIQIVASSINGCSLSLVSPTLSYNATPQNLLIGKFTTGSSLSISGWFKTLATGVLFSNRDSSQGLKVEVTNSGIDITHNSTTVSYNNGGPFKDGQWHHFCLRRYANNNYEVFVDNLGAGTTYQLAQADTDWLGTNGFTLLSDGDNNAHAASPGVTDASKLNASLSNWSIHGEALSDMAIKQIYSNGHVRNIKNLPDVNVAQITAWWKLADTTNPQNDLIGSNHLQYIKRNQTTNTNENYLEGLRLYNSTSEIDFQVNTPFNPFSGTYSTAMPNLADDFTISMWVYIDGAANTGAVNLIRVGNNNAKFGIYHGASTKITAYMASAAGDYNIIGGTPSVNPVGSSAHVVAQKSGNTLSLYHNGTLVGSVTVSISNSSWGEGNGTVDFFELSARYLSLAQGSASRGDKSARISEIAFYNSALSTTDISALASKPGAANTVASSNLKTYFKMGDGPNDNIASELVYDTVNYNSSYYIEDTSTSGNATISSLATSDPAYTDGSVIGAAALSTDLVDATGVTLVEKSINGNALTLSITKNFNFTTESWVSDASGETALCLSLNGFEEQAEYFALWKCSQTLPDGVVDVCDGNWHNIALSYRGQNDLAGDNVAEGDAVRFGRGSSDNPFNFSLAIDGYPVYTEIANNTGADYIGGNNTLLTDTINSVTYNVGFNIYNRHLKYDPNNNNEQYRVHGQFGSGVHTYLTNETDPHSFRGEVDETSFHTDPWWSNADGTNIDVFGSDTSKRGNLFNQEKTYTLYGRTTALANRGTNARYPLGVPYPLLNPELLVNSGNIADIEGTNQFLNPVRKGDTQSWDSQASAGGLEGWWRWGDTPGDCSITVNDVKDHGSTPAVDYRDIDAVYLTDQGTSSNVVLATSESIYLASQAASTTPGSAGVQYNQIKLENLSSLVGTAACAVKDFVSPVLQYLRIKLTGTGTCDIGDGKLEIEVNHKKRRMK